MSIPQPRVRPLVGNAPDIDAEQPIQSMMRLAAEHGSLFRLTFPMRSFLVASSQELAAELCDETRFEKIVHGPLEEIRAFAGDGLFTAHSDEPNWGKAHRLLMPAFGPAAMRGYFEDMLDVADQMFIRWERFGPEESIDVADQMTRLTLDTIALCGFGYRFNSFYQRDMHPFVDAMLRALAEAGLRTRRLPLHNQLLFMSQRQYEADARLMHGITDELVQRRRALDPAQAPRDLLGLMLTAVDSVTGDRLSDENIRNQLVTFLIAGHETTSGLLSFATHLLLEHPDVAARARAEVDAVIGDDSPRFEHVAKLGYIDQILRETLRLHPTAPAFAVTPKTRTRLGEHLLERDQMVLVLLPTLHRDPAVWPDPTKFDPDRFAPGARELIPPAAWLPFGNGVRSCIGRAFAMQEATLVLAMMLQRFDIERPEPYELVIKETLTLKPDGLRLRARLRPPVARVTPTRPAAVLGAVSDSAPGRVARHDTPLLVLFGSNSGASEAFARRIASDGAARGYAAAVAALDEHVDRLPRTGAVVIVTASYNGLPPDNARRFCEWIAAAPEGSQTGVRYAVFGCGNRDWGATYQQVPTALDAHLARAGAEPLLPRGEADARADFFGEFEDWYQPVWKTLGVALGVDATEAPQGPLYAVEVVPSPATVLVEQNRLAMATVLENRELVDMSSPLGRSKRHLELALPEGVTYVAGDYLAVLPENAPELVERAARRFGLRPDAAILLRSTRGAMAASLPTDRPVSVQELLARHVELSAPATRKDLERLAACNPCPPHRDHLAALAAEADRYRAEILEKRVSVLDLLEKYPSSDLPFAELLELLPTMRVRQYSISSSPRQAPGRCSLTVAVIDAAAWSGIGQFRGTCSSFLARLRPGDQVAAAVRSPKNAFHPPVSNATPVILVAAGTGLAPFRGFLQDRALRARAGEPAGRALLFFGCDHPDVDFLYRSELEALGVELHAAFFHQPDGDIRFVQHRLWEERAQVRELMAAGATFFVCGDGQRMAPAVRETLGRIVAEPVDDLERAARYVADVFA